MTSSLIVVPVDKLQGSIVKTVKSFKNVPKVYVSLNKAKKSAEEALQKKGVKTKGIFFIDCVASDKKEKDVFYTKPTELDELIYILRCFNKEIKGERKILIDSLATLLIYNHENKVANFVKKLTALSSKKQTDVVALSQNTEEKLLNKVFNFFDKVEKKE